MNMQNLLKKRRIELGYTGREVARRCGVAESTYSRWESGNIANMSRDKIKALADTLQISPALIIGGDEEIQRKEDEALEQVKYALFSGETEVTPEMWNEVKEFAKYVESKYNK